MASTDKISSSRTGLNPEASEFFPAGHLSNIVYYTHHYLPNYPFVSEINQNPSYCYYSTSEPISYPDNLYYYTNSTDYEYPSKAQHCVTHSGYSHDPLVSTTFSAQKQMVQTKDETKVDMQRVGTVSKERGECSRHAGGANSGQKHPVLPVLPDGQKTTVMIKNVPNKYTRAMLMEFLDSHCMMENEKAKLQNPDSTKKTAVSTVSAFDFLYLPIDFKNGSNKGYAFVNFTNAKAAWKFFLSANHQAWDLFRSKKIREIVSSRLQGMELVRYFEKSTFECDTDEYLPVYFTPARDGSKKMVKQKTIGRRKK